MTRRFLSSDEAIPAKKQHKKPCADCPWARRAINGWLGGRSPKEWVDTARGDGPVVCHTLQKTECAGAAIFRANIAKSPRDGSLLRLPADRARVFATPEEFHEHHKKAPTMPTLSPVHDIIDQVANIERDEEMSREDYREFLIDLRDEIDVKIAALNEDDERDARRRG